MGVFFYHFYVCVFWVFDAFYAFDFGFSIFDFHCALFPKSTLIKLQTYVYIICINNRVIYVYIEFKNVQHSFLTKEPEEAVAVAPAAYVVKNSKDSHSKNN